MFCSKIWPRRVRWHEREREKLRRWDPREITRVEEEVESRAYLHTMTHNCLCRRQGHAWCGRLRQRRVRYWLRLEGERRWGWRERERQNGGGSGQAAYLLTKSRRRCRPPVLAASVAAWKHRQRRWARLAPKDLLPHHMIVFYCDVAAAVGGRRRRHTWGSCSGEAG
jgi:hypothetical protein